MTWARAAWSWLTVPAMRARASFALLMTLAVGMIVQAFNPLAAFPFFVGTIAFTIADWRRSPPVPEVPLKAYRAPTDEDRALARELVTLILIASQARTYDEPVSRIRGLTDDADMVALTLALLGIQNVVLAGAAAGFGRKVGDSDEAASDAMWMWQRFAPLLSKAGM